MFKNKPIGFFRFSLIDLIRKFITHKLFGSGILSHTPSIRLTVLVGHIHKVADDNIALLLQSGDGGIKALVATLAIITELFQFFGYDRSVIVKQIIEDFIGMLCKPLIVPCIEVISVTAIVCKVGKPLLADIDRFVFKELSIGTACFLNDRTFPFPRIPLSAVRVIPVFRCNMLLYGKAFDTVSEERQNTYLSLLSGQFPT